MTDEEFKASPKAPPDKIAGNGAHGLSAADARRAVHQGVHAAGNAPFAAVGRTLPHSLEAEEALLSTCLLDGDVVGRCLESRISPDSFYDSNHGIIFERLVDLHARKVPIDISVIAEELKASRQLDQVGGYAFLMQVSGRIPTTAQASYFIAKVHEQALLRDIIRSATGTVEDCYGFTTGIEDFGSGIRRRFDQVLGNQRCGGQRMDWDQLLAFDPKQDPDCLMGNRFLGRTGTLVVVAPSGVGKSVLGFQFGACAALQRPFFSVRMHCPMRVLYVQAEDDFGDVSESVQGFVRGYDVTPTELTQLKTRLRIERWNDVSGSQFILRLRRIYETWPFDLVIINPLFAFAGCNISEQKELSPFLRNQLNPVLNEIRAAAVIIHHTNKPPQDPSAQDKAMDAELRYLGSGSAELTNFARAYITLQGVRAAGDHVHKMVFVKRGNRAGVVDGEGKPTHSVFIEHAKHGLCWLASDYRPDAVGGKFVTRFDMDRALSVYDSSKHWTENEILIARDQNMTPRGVRKHRQEIEERG